MTAPFSRLLTALLVFVLVGAASARDAFGLFPFSPSEFRDADKLRTACSAPAAAAFFCADLEQELTRVPTKGVDLFFSEAGEVVAAFAKVQKGQSLSTYQVENRDNLVPYDQAIPAGALLLDGVYHEPTGLTSSWVQVDPVTLRGGFRYLLAGLEVEVDVVVSDVVQTLTYDIRVRTAAGGGAEAVAPPRTVQFVVAGIGRQDSPTIKVGQASAFTLNPLTVPVDGATYVSLQTNNRNRDNAIILTPGLGLGSAGDPLQGISLGDRRVAMQVPFDGQARLTVGLYLGKNELVRFYQEGYDALPGLFSPNILGRMSLWVLIALDFIYAYVNNWALSIIVLTLLFRVLVWPLITTQTRSMFGMQQLQPQLQKLQKKYKDDREKLTQETMKLYKEAGVNPAGGCLPILLQMPLFIILWRVFVNFEFNEGFLWIPDLGLPDPWYILPALYVMVMLAMSWFSAKGNPTMLRQSVLINLVFVFIMVGFPAGVLLYFVVSMSVQVFQYWLLSRNQPAPAAAKA
ncbi:MAG: membrane protein insertase YidC [bacterium]|nr:membrane protein insertase YidC [bacterium]